MVRFLLWPHLHFLLLLLLFSPLLSLSVSDVFADECDTTPRKSSDGYLLCERIELPMNGDDTGQTTLELDPAVQYDVILTSRFSLKPLFTCARYDVSEQGTICFPYELPIEFNGERLQVFAEQDAITQLIPSYFVFEPNPHPYIPTIRFRFWGHGKPLSLKLRRDYSAKIGLTYAIVKDSSYQLRMRDQATWIATRDRLIKAAHDLGLAKEGDSISMVVDALVGEYKQLRQDEEVGFESRFDVWSWVLIGGICIICVFVAILIFLPKHTYPYEVSELRRILQERNELLDEKDELIAQLTDRIASLLIDNNSIGKGV